MTGVHKDLGAGQRADAQGERARVIAAALDDFGDAAAA